MESAGLGRRTYDFGGLGASPPLLEGRARQRDLVIRGSVGELVKEGINE